MKQPYISSVVTRSMKKNILRSACLFVTFAAMPFFASAQQATINAGPDDTICNGSVTLTATLPTAINGTALSLSDDQYSGVINIGFTFNYFGTNYTQCLISSNNYITFNLGGAGGYSPWPISAAIPTASDPTNSIMCPWEDLLPPAGGSIVYATLGTAPNRMFVVAYCSVAMFSCTNLYFTNQIILYEGSNVIETHISNKPLCPSWNGGCAIHGIQNNAGSIAFVVPGRNYPMQWTTSNEGYRWTPVNATTYTQGFIPFAPVILSATTGPVQWYANNVLIGTGNSITVSPSTTTAYAAVVTGGCIGGSSDTVVVHVMPLSVNAGNDTSICAGGSTQLNATSPNTVSTWSWSPTTGLSNPNIPNPVASPVTTTTYVVTGSNGAGCTSTDTVVVTVLPASTATVGANDSVCSGSCTQLSASGGGTYQWAPDPSFSGATNISNPTVCPTVTTTYSVTVTAASGCVSTAQQMVYVAPQPLAVSLSSTNILCHGSCTGSASVNPSGGFTPYTYSWSNGNTTSSISNQCAGNYSCSITDAIGCSVVQNVSITEPLQLVVNIATFTNTSCGLNNGSATANAVGGAGGNIIAWTPSGGNGLTASSLAPNTYTVTVTDVNGCIATATVTIAPSNAAVATFSGQDTTGCAPVCVQLTNTSPSSSTCLWDFGDNNTSSNCNPTHCYNTPGSYNVTLTISDGSGCTATSTHNNMIVVHPQPVAAFTASPDTASEYNPVVQFTDQSISPQTWFWSFGDLNQSSSILQNPSFIYPDTGAYVVTLIVSNSFGCADTLSEVVYIQPELSFYVPNAFTPNGDGRNDVFMPAGDNIDPTAFHMWIFDRWGNLVYQTTDLNKGWDGRMQGHSDMSQIDTYVWKITFNDVNHKKHSYIGHVSLIR